MRAHTAREGRIIQPHARCARQEGSASPRAARLRKWTGHSAPRRTRTAGQAVLEYVRDTPELVT